jgi:hypothetical protein
MKALNPAAGIAGLLLVAGCVTLPNGPSMMVLPGTGRSFDDFRTDDVVCRQYAHEQVGGRTGQLAAEDSGVRSAALGTLLGAAAGAAINGGHGAAVGAGAGLAMGGLAGTAAAESSGHGAQRRYDHAYIPCMYAKGHRVPTSGRFTTYTEPPRPPARAATPPPPAGMAPAPASSVPPAPPSGAPPAPPPPGSAPTR